MSENSYKFEIGQRIKSTRIHHKLTQAQLAEALNISVNFLSEVENGKKGLSQETICKICNYFDISADYILFGKEEHLTGQNIIEIADSLSNEELETITEYLSALRKIRSI